MNELSAAGNQVASFMMNSLGAFSASPQLPFCHSNLCALFPETLYLPYPYLTEPPPYILMLLCCVSLFQSHSQLLLFSSSAPRYKPQIQTFLFPQ